MLVCREKNEKLPYFLLFPSSPEPDMNDATSAAPLPKLPDLFKINP